MAFETEVSCSPRSIFDRAAREIPARAASSLSVRLLCRRRDRTRAPNTRAPVSSDFAMIPS
ncbi:Uncharacterised protein [Mycobacteroides abscessus subsp. abscessus]|nr:Uncharacterised protein [Mycobacteroides abscessus subsp. abscessus]